MLKNYITIAWRNLRKSKLYSSINIIGLATGMAITLLIGLWIADECSFDHYHRDHARLVRVAELASESKGGPIYTNLTIAMPLGAALRKDYGRGLKYMSLVSGDEGHILAGEGKKIKGKGIWVQQEFPTMFTLDMLSGNRDALKDPSTLLISRSLAISLFGRQDPLNKVVRVDNRFELKVGGVYEDLPFNSDFYGITCLLPWDNKENWLASKDPQSNWYNHCGYLYAELNDGIDVEQAAAAIRKVPTSHIEGYRQEATLFPLDKLHLYNEFDNGKMIGGRLRFVWLFGIIGVFVLLLACINFMNLSTARSEKRAREVGIRKAVGSVRWQLIAQFISESLAVAFLALALALILATVSLPFFNGLADKHMSMPWSQPVFWLLLLAFTLFTGFVAGSYPAFYLSGFNPVSVLKGSFKAGRSASVPRKVLVVVQFTVSVSLIIGTIIVFRQIQFAKARPVGYSRDGLVVVDMNTDELHQHSEAIRSELLESGAITDMAQTNSLPTEISSGNSGFYWKGQDPGNTNEYGTLNTSYDYGHTIGWQVVQGRDFSRNFPGDTAGGMGSVIMNETAAKLSGDEHPVGKVLWYKGTIFSNVGHVVVGVVKDMVMESPYKKPEAVLFFCGGWNNSMVLRANPALPMREALSKMEPVFRKYNPESPFDYSFIDAIYAKKFSEEQRIGSLAAFFTIFAIFISCLGLFGLASFVAEQRVKEIGVRKVLGASVFNLWQLLSKEFMLLVILSCCIAAPLAWYFLHAWLQQYEYRTPVSWWIFAAAGGGALLITLLTVSYQAIRAALTNPAKSLRTE